MSSFHIISLLIAYKYIILFPVAFFEGHIVSLISGFLAKLGYINAVFAWIIISSANLLGDIILYWIGYHRGERAVLWVGKYLGITKEMIEKSKLIFHKYHGRILFFSKLSNGFGFAMAVLFTAGMVRIRFSRYMAWNVLGESVWSGMLVILGYIFGHLYITVENILFRVGLTGFLLFIVYVFLKARKYWANQVSS